EGQWTSSSLAPPLMQNDSVRGLQTVGTLSSDMSAGAIVVPLTALPLTPVQIDAPGVVQGTPASVRFSNNSGFTFSDQPIRINSDGTVVVAVPLYVDPGTGNITQGSVSMVVTQDSRVSPAVQLQIQDLPPLSSYGARLGQISHS